MKRVQTTSAGENPLFSPPLLSDAEWRTVVATLRLTPQQAKVVALILHGKRDKQIAVEMGVSIWAVRNHLTCVFVRLGINDRIDLVMRVFTTVREMTPTAR